MAAKTTSTKSKPGVMTQVASSGVQSLLNPENVVIAGASDRPGNWAARLWRNLHKYGYPGKVYPLNPGRDDVWETKCYRSFDALPEKPDHVMVLVPAHHVCPTLRDAAAAGARSACVITAGFGEALDKESQALARELKHTIEETGLAVSGPNCLGNINAGANFIAMPDDRPQSTGPGPIAVVGQSGGLVMAIKRTLEERGMRAGHLITSGNEAGLTTGDYINYFANENSTKVIVCYLEAVRKPQQFLAAARKACANGKHVIVVKLGGSEEGRNAAMAHTGALAGDMAAFDAVTRSAGILRAETLDEIVELCEYCLHAKMPGGAGLGAITFSGGLRGLLLDQAQYAGMKFNKLRASTRRKLEALLSVGTIIGNPLDSGFAALSSSETYIKCVETMLDDPGIDLLLLQEELPRAPGSAQKEGNLVAVNDLAARAKKPIVFVTMISHGLNEYARDLRDGLRNVAFLQEPQKAMKLARKIADHATVMRKKTKARRLTSEPVKPPLRKVLAEPFPAGSKISLAEHEAKAIMRAHGIPIPKENFAPSLQLASDSARRIGYPVVLKSCARGLEHKSEIGGVVLNITDDAELQQAWKTIGRNMKRHRPGMPFEGALVCQTVKPGLELVLGAMNDPEVGPVVMFGAGGVTLEIHPDVAFAAPVQNRVEAMDLIGRTHIAKVIDGYRGSAPLDKEALARALVGISTLACSLGERLHSIDVNPFVLHKRGGRALDALIILQN